MNYNLHTFRHDVIGGVTTTIISLPVALGFGIASGLGASAGIWSAIAVGCFASVFGGTRGQISGPTAPTAVAMAVVLTSHSNNLAEALTIVFFAGFIQVFLGISKIGKFVAYTPHVVISGFMSGIGIIVMLIQLLPMLGAENTTEGVFGVVQALPNAIANVQIGALIIGVVTLSVGFLWPKKLARILPRPLAALASGTVLGILFFKDAAVIGSIPIGLPSLHIPILSLDFLLKLVEPAIILALLASVETLLTSLVADSMTGARHNPTKELIGQGIGNMAAGLIGATPGAGAALGTVANIQSGGQTAVSGVVRSAVLFALALGLGQFVEPIPLAALAAVLFKVGWDLTDKQTLFRIHRLRREHQFVLILVLGLTVLIDLITAVAIGLIAGAMVLARRQEEFESRNVISLPILDAHFFAGDNSMLGDDPFAARVGMVTMRGVLTVASSHNLVSVLGHDIKEHEVVIFDFSDTIYIDDSVAIVIRRLIKVANQSNTSCIIKGLTHDVAVTLNGFDILGSLPDEQVVASEEDARIVAKKLLLENDNA